MKKKIYFENLDGLRFLCFLSVFFFHGFHTEYSHIKNSSAYLFIKKDLFGNGNLGVNFFFVLSGFLITFLLIEEKKLNGRINLKNFWVRRILRIWPLFYFCMLFGFFLFPQLKIAFGQTPDESASIWYYLIFLNNFDFIKNGLPDSSVLGVLWSVAIEEQFYLIWPIILNVIPIRKYWAPFCFIILLSIVFRIFYDSPILHEHHTLSCIGDMAIGALGAWTVSVSSKILDKIKNLKSIYILLIYAIFFFLFFFRDEMANESSLFRIFERVIIATFVLLIILEQNYSKNSFFKLSKYKIISKLGEISYGLYCLHFIGILTALTITKILGFNVFLWQVIIIDTIVSLVLTILISKMSFKFYERPFLKLKEKFTYISR